MISTPLTIDGHTPTAEQFQEMQREATFAASRELGRMLPWLQPSQRGDWLRAFAESLREIASEQDAAFARLN